MSNVELKGFLCTQGKDCSTIVKSIAIKVNCVVTDSDIPTVPCVPVKAGEHRHITRFS